MLMGKMANDSQNKSKNDASKRNADENTQQQPDKFAVSMNPVKRRKLENNNVSNMVNVKSTNAMKNDKPMGNGQTISGVEQPPKLTKIMRSTECQRDAVNLPNIGSGITVLPVRKMPNEMSKKFKREVVVTNSPITFEDLGGMDKTLMELCELLLHIKHPEVYKHIGLPPPRGFLLHGPPGSGKTLLAQAIAGVSCITHGPLSIITDDI